MLAFLVGSTKAFEVSLADVSQTQLQGKNEIMLEFRMDGTTGANEVRYLPVYALSWLVIVGAMIILKIVSMGRKTFSADFQLMFRMLKTFLFVGFIVILTLLFVLAHLTAGDIFVSLLAFMPSGWALLQISQALRQPMKTLGLWGSVKALARGYEYVMGIVIFTPVAVLAWFPFVSDFQTRLLFNQAFSRGLQISRILAGGKKQK